MSRRSRLISRPHLESLDRRLLLSATSASSLTPAQIQAAYGLDAIKFSANGQAVAGDGAGQTIAIVDAYHDPNAAAELAAFDARYGLPAANLGVDNLGSAGNTNAGWAEEEALDIEAAHLAAPGAGLLLVEAKSDSTADLMAAVAQANATPGVTVVSMSWGGQDTGVETAYDSYFSQPGITYLAASGDGGSGAEWPSDSPNVIAVGGTSLLVGGSGRGSESAWAGSGGGISLVEAEPGYQSAAQSTGSRATPDVSAVADPNTGLSAYSAAGGWIQVGGTSLATPIWAGVIAVADEGRALEGKATLSSAVALADLYNAPAGSFYDVTGGPGASTSYDTATGLGTPNAPTLVAALVADPSTTPSATGNGVGGDPPPAAGGGSTGGGTLLGGSTTGGGASAPPQDPNAPPFGGGGYYGNPGSYPGRWGRWGGSSLPRNPGQGATDPFLPIIPILGYGDPSPVATTPPQPTTPPKPPKGPATPVDHEPTKTTTHKTTRSSTTKSSSSKKHASPKPTTHSTSTTAKHHAVDAVIHALGRRRA